MIELEDLTPLYGQESWETWLVMVKTGIYPSWSAWIDLWKSTMDKYWEGIRRAPG